MIKAVKILLVALLCAVTQQVAAQEIFITEGETVVYRVWLDESIQGGTISDALQNLPGVRVDVAEQRIIQLVRKAFEQLKNEIAGKEIIPVIQVPCGLNIRNSTAAPPQKGKSETRLFLGSLPEHS